ncbi:chemotaxis protein CheB [Labrys okinawensis]|uniref:chemotaxis protein CheB n=1 Tax=Labrys okinawensis TaxID=346911 RepID=UPI0015E2D6B4|nr:chemotaxis protein CheB [Labrys okinawensis]
MDRRDIIAIGGSFGAVSAVQRLCHDLPADLGAAVFIVIHVGPSGTNQLASIFNERSSLSVTTAAEGELVRKGHVYVAPADRHLLVIDGRIRLGYGPRENMARPAIDPLFRSAAVGFGSRMIAVVLTGLLNDGAAGLADVKRCGGTTVVQNPADAEAPDMPMSALRASDVDYRSSLSDLAALLVKLSREQAGPRMEIPSEIRTEVEIALGNSASSDVVAGIADPVPLSCPACGGVLSQVRRGPLRFRCQVGHAYTADILADQQEDAVDEALRVALRIMEERAIVTQKLAEEARMAGRTAAAASYGDRLRESRGYADTLRRAIERATSADVS